MSTFVFRNAKKRILDGGIDFDEQNAFVIALVNSTLFDLSNYSADTWSDISSHEISSSTNSGYQKVTLVNNGVNYNSSQPYSTAYANNVDFGPSSYSLAGFVIYKKTSGNDGIPIVAVDIRTGGTNVQTINGILTINLSLSSGGFLRLS